MASGPDSTQVPLPEDDNDFDLFGPADTAGAGGTGQPQQPVPPGPAQQPPVAPAVQQVTVGLDPAMQQMMLQMMQSQQTMLEMLNKRMDAEEKRRKDQEASQAAVVNPFGPGGTAGGSPTHGGGSGSGYAPVVSAPSASGVGSNRAEKYLPSLPLIEHGQMNKGRVKELEEYHRWLEVLASWLALIDDNYVGELRQALVHGTDIKQSALAAPVASRSAKLFYYLQQSLQKFDRGMELVRSTSMRQGQAACGYECMRQLHNTFSVVARMEAIAVRDEALKLSGKASGYKRPLDAVRFFRR